jgi:hypothetical protein
MVYLPMTGMVQGVSKRITIMGKELSLKCHKRLTVQSVFFHYNENLKVLSNY